VRVDYHVTAATEIEAVKAFFAIANSLFVYPFKFARMFFSNLAVGLEQPLIVPCTAWLSRFLEHHHVIFNLVSNPLINLGILFEFLLCYLFFYTPLSTIYYFAPVPWHVYLFAFHGTVLLVIFEETKKYYRRKGHPLEFLG